MDTYLKIRTDLFRIVITIRLTVLVLNFFKVGWDSTDGEVRSGLRLHTDNLTSCQYLSTPNGDLTPRLDSAGKHICNRQEP